MTSSILLLLLYLVWPSCLLGDDTFLIYNDGGRQCLKADDAAVIMAECNENSILQQYKWISKEQLINIGTSQCLAVVSVDESSAVVLQTCDGNSDLQKWECKNETLFGVSKSDRYMSYRDNRMILSTKTGDWSQWKIHSTTENLCAKSYEEIFTLQGNSNGQPCKFPFKYINKVYVDCAKSGKYKGIYWCSTTSDYDKDQLYGYCPSKATADPFWARDPVTGIYYQANRDAALTWYQARRSCQQQDAELLSITELHEQSFISGLTHGHTTTLWIGLNNLDVDAGWRWDGGDPFRYLNWLPGNPSEDPDVNCVGVNLERNTKWESRMCSQRLGYICKKGNKTSPDVPSSETPGPISCPSSWTPYNGYCYYLVKDTKMWKDAKLLCRKEEGDLVSVHNIEEASAIFTQFEFGDAEYVWLGLNDLKTQMLYEWSDGSPVTYTTWQRGEPSHQTNDQEDCVALSTKDGQWADQMCEKKFPYICKRKPLPKAPEQVLHADPGCDEGWRRHGHYCYLIGESPRSFTEANSTCGHHGASLLTVQDSTEEAYVISLIGFRPEKYFWTGLSDTEERNTFTWTNKERVLYTNWNVDMPDGRRGCVAMRTGRKAGLWDVINCDEKAKFLCKKFAQGVTPPTPPATTPEPACLSNWTSLDHGCVKYYYEENYAKKTWTEARDFCQAIGGDLLSISSYKDNEVVSAMLKAEFHQEYKKAWIGLRIKHLEEQFTWTDGSPVTYENRMFYSMHDYLDHEPLCVFLYPYGWNAGDCDKVREWMCKLKKGTVLKDEPKPPDYEFTSDGWLIYNDSHYYISQDEMPMEKALEYCKHNFSHLVTINSESEITFLWQYILYKRAQSSYYIGLRLGLDREFKWMDGSPIDFVAWKLNQPDFSNNDEFCVEMTAPYGHWNDINCGVPHGFICERTNSSINTPLAPTIPAPEGGCGSDWLSFRQKCYRIYDPKDESLHWDDARSRCQSFGGNLVTINDDLVQSFLMSNLKNITDDVWIGLHDKNKDNKFVWTDQSGVYYTNWAKGWPQPRSRLWSDTDCVAIQHGYVVGDGTWIEEDCSLERGYICQKYKDPHVPVIPTAPPDYNNYITYEDARYKFDRTKRTWEEARQECMKEKSQLASILDGYTTSFLKLHLVKLKEPFWIGLYSRNETRNTYRWVDNWRVHYTKWAPEEPSKDTSCVYVDRDGQWKTSSCDESYSSICKQTHVVPPTDPPETPGTCPNITSQTWMPFRGHCYLFEASSTWWSEAITKCFQMGGHLVSIKDSLESDFLHRHTNLLSDQQQNFWIGLYKNVEDKWFWLDKTPLDYVNWKINTKPEFENGIRGGCPAMHSTKGTWDNKWCLSHLGYICKTAKTPLSTEKPLEEPVEKPLHGATIVVVVLVILVLAGVTATVIFVLKRKVINLQPGNGLMDRIYFDRSQAAAKQEENVLVENNEQDEYADS
ncbi:macrophage mannose receptor 1-like isoform X1 [Engystomops pustulosus]|uniref:macrophage mannose receptor 1-like isoform X1 n=1 Tax=Engystomops pustulosus TaxID=76066 RepID=UPI003AFADBC6